VILDPQQFQQLFFPGPGNDFINQSGEKTGFARDLNPGCCQGSAQNNFLPGVNFLIKPIMASVQSA